MTVFPLLETAEKEFAKTPHDPFEHGPASYQSAITEAIRDAQANPGQDTDEFPHRAPIKLDDEEFAILTKLTKARGLPSPEKRTFNYTDHVALLDARSGALQKSPAYLAIQQRMIREGMLKPRAQIAEETRQRQAPWTAGSPKTPPRRPQK